MQHVHGVLTNLPISETCLKEFQLESKIDPILQTLITYATYERPGKQHLIPTYLYQYYTRRNDITFCEGILLKNERIFSTRYPLSRNEIPYPPRTFWN